MRSCRIRWLFLAAILFQVCTFIQTTIFLQQHQNGKKIVSTAPKPGAVFVPGSLSDRNEILAHCYADPQRYQDHFGKKHLSLVVPSNNIVHHMVSKAGSSSARIILRDHFHATVVDETMSSNASCHFAIIREPTSRFLSAYQESLKRILIMKQRYPNRLKHFPQEYLPFLKQLPNTLAAYKEMGNRENATRALETFLEDYDAAKVLEGHLRLQVPRLSNPSTGRPMPGLSLVDLPDMTQHFQDLARQLELPPPIEKHVYHRGTTLLNPLTSKAKRKICQLSALDYCCLNYKLPIECQGAVMCRWNQDLLIEAVSPYPSIPRTAGVGKAENNR